MTGYKLSELSLTEFKKKKVWLERIEEDYKKQKEDEQHDNICCEMPEMRLAPVNQRKKRPVVISLESENEMLQMRENIKSNSAPENKQPRRSAKVPSKMERR